MTGCATKISTNPHNYVGEYVFQPSSAYPGSFASFVVLREDQTATEIHVARQTGQVQIIESKWYLYHTTSENLALGKFSYPIEGSGSGVKLEANGDLGQYYEKVR
jgi:hypothetical protein